MCDASYEVTVAFVNFSGEVGQPAPPVTLAAAPCDPGPPPAPSNLVLYEESSYGWSMKWDSPPVNDVQWVYFKVQDPLWPDRPPLKISADQESFTWITGLRCSQTYTVEMFFRAFDGQDSPSTFLTHQVGGCADQVPPPPPANLRVVGQSDGSTTYAWDQPPDGGLIGSQEIICTVVSLTAPDGNTIIRNFVAEPVYPRVYVAQLTLPVAACGTHEITVAWLYSSGDLSQPARLRQPDTPCPKPAPAPPKPNAPPQAPAARRRQKPIIAVVAQTRRVRVDRTGRFTLGGGTVTCPTNTETCQVETSTFAKLPGKHGTAFLGKVRSRLSRGQTLGLTGRLSAKGQEILRRHGPLRVRVSIGASNAWGFVGRPVSATLVPPRSVARS